MGPQLPDLPGTSNPGQDPPLYGVWGTSYKALDEFGIGVGLYYRQLLFLGIVSRILPSAGPIGGCRCPLNCQIVRHAVYFGEVEGTPLGERCNEEVLYGGVVCEALVAD